MPWNTPSKHGEATYYDFSLAKNLTNYKYTSDAVLKFGEDLVAVCVESDKQCKQGGVLGMKGRQQ